MPVLLTKMLGMFRMEEAIGVPVDLTFTPR
jgi:hypothetical protein